MYKEIIACIIIITSILILDNRTQSYTENSVLETTNQLEVLRQEIKNQESNEEKLKKDMDEIYNKWMGFHDKLAFYIEHDELEKIETELTALKGDIEVKKYDDAITQLDKSIFILKHIKDKYKFNLDNIF